MVGSNCKNVKSEVRKGLKEKYVESTFDILLLNEITFLSLA